MQELTETISTDHLRQGDVVHHHGMRLVIDVAIDTFPAPGPAPETVYYSPALISNWDEIEAQAAIDDAEDICNGSAQFIRAHADTDADGNRRWTIQGNRLALWTRENPRLPAPDCTATLYLTCPYYRGVPGGLCLNGCRDEPSCITGEPDGGWQPRNAAGEPVTVTDEDLDQIARDRWGLVMAQEHEEEIRARTCTPAELAAIRREFEEDEAESDRLEAEQHAQHAPADDETETVVLESDAALAELRQRLAKEGVIPSTD